jgi:hypothetical protein
MLGSRNPNEYETHNSAAALDDHVKQAIADKIIELAKGGERNPDVLCERALKDIRRPEM